MKNFILLFAAVMISHIAIGQNLIEKELIGAWKTQSLLKRPSNPHYRDICDSFKASTFTFGEDHIFDIKSDQNSQEFAVLRKMAKQKSWKFDEATQTIEIGDANDNFSTMKIKVKNTEGKISFVLDESQHGLELEVKKYETKKTE